MITVTVDVSPTAQTGALNQVYVLDGATILDISSVPTTITTVCDLNIDGNTNVSDVQRMINEALGVTPGLHDLNHDGFINVADVQRVINGALGLGCPA